MAKQEQKIITRGFGIGGYRSYAQEVQWLDPLSQVNVIIGENNLGKSNMLFFIAQEYTLMVDKIRFLSSPYVHSSDLNENVENCKFQFGMSLGPFRHPSRKFKDDATELLLNRVLNRIESIGIARIAFEYDSSRLDIPKSYVNSIIDELQESEWQTLAHSFSGESYNNNAFLNCRSTIRSLLDFYKNKSDERIEPIFIPAKREANRTERLMVAPKSCIYFDGSGLGKLIADHKNAGDDYNEKYPLYEKMIRIIRQTMADDTVEVNIPHGETWVQVRIRNKAKRLDTLGTGIQEVIHVAAAATFYSNRMVCIEEPETHLHPAWLKRLIRQLFETENQYFIASHSASLIDIPGVSVFQLEGTSDGTKITHAVSARQKAAICDVIGFKPSDLMQTNCIVWVEGPSDRIYINHWIHLSAPELCEGVHYTVMTYGGSLGTHLTADDLRTKDQGEAIEYPEQVEDLINVRTLNHRVAIVLDSDKKADSEKLTPVKKRLMAAFNRGPGFAWVTSGRTIENYFHEKDVASAMKKFHPKSKPACDKGQGKYQILARLESKTGKFRDANKVKIAEYLTEKGTEVRKDLDLELQLGKLIQFIRKSNENR